MLQVRGPTKRRRKAIRPAQTKHHSTEPPGSPPGIQARELPACADSSGTLHRVWVVPHHPAPSRFQRCAVQPDAFVLLGIHAGDKFTVEMWSERLPVAVEIGGVHSSINKQRAKECTAAMQPRFQEKKRHRADPLQSCRWPPLCPWSVTKLAERLSFTVAFSTEAS